MANQSKSVIALGTFDGVHLGHQKIINTLLEKAKEINAQPIIVTFFPHPTHILTPEKPLKMISNIDERLKKLRSKGVATVVVKEFTREFSKISALDFIKQELLQNLNMHTLIVGYDHSFGRDKEGDFNTLKEHGKSLGFNVVQVEAFRFNQLSISSTLIRSELSQGNIQMANQYLDYSFCLHGAVVKGNQLGRELGFRTANIILDYPNKIIPKTGVYLVQSKINGKRYFGMMNIGFRPTINGRMRTIEVHYFSFNQSIYGQKVRVHLLQRLRDEIKFDSLNDLKKQLKKDKINSLKLIKNSN